MGDVVSEHNEMWESRLRAADSFAGTPYEHADLAAVLERVTAMPRVTKASFAQGFRMKMASAAAAAVLVTSGGIAVLSSAGSMAPALALGAAAKTSVTTTPQASFVGRPDMMLANLRLVAGPDLTTGTTSARAYVFVEPSDLAAASDTVARALGVVGTPSAVPATNTSWTVGSAESGYIDFWSDGSILSWSYTQSAAGGGVVSSPPTTPATGATSGTGSALSNDEALSRAQNLLSALGVSGTFGDPQFSTDQVSPYGSSTSTWWTTVNLPWYVNGIDTSNSFSFTFDEHGNLASANGLVATVTDKGIYPVVSEVTAAQELIASYGNFSGGGVPSTTPVTVVTPVSVPTTDVTSTTTPVPSVGTSPGSVGTTVPSSVAGEPPATTETTVPTSDPTPVTVETPVVTLISATLQYGEYTLSDGTDALLPEYVFTADNGGTYTQMAVDPHYVSLADRPSGVMPMAR